MSPEVLAWGEQIVTISVLSIVFCAPIGSLLIMNLGPMLLDNALPDHKESKLDMVSIVEEEKDNHNHKKQ